MMLRLDLQGRHELYKTGFILFFLAMFLSIASVFVPGYWMYDKGNADSETAVGRSIWFTSIRTCLNDHGHASKWRCNTIPVDDNQEWKQLGVVLIVLGTLTQVAACLVIMIVNSTKVPGAQTHMYAEISAGAAAMLSVTGLLVYTRFTHHSVNVTYGPGYFSHWVALLLAYVGLVLTALYSHPTKPSTDS